MFSNLTHDGQLQQWKVKNNNEWFNVGKQKTKKYILNEENDKKLKREIELEVSSFNTDQSISESSSSINSRKVDVSVEGLLNNTLAVPQIKKEDEGTDKDDLDLNK